MTLTGTLIGLASVAVIALLLIYSDELGRHHEYPQKED